MKITQYTFCVAGKGFPKANVSMMTRSMGCICNRHFRLSSVAVFGRSPWLGFFSVLFYLLVARGCLEVNLPIKGSVIPIYPVCILTLKVNHL